MNKVLVCNIYDRLNPAASNWLILNRKIEEVMPPFAIVTSLLRLKSILNIYSNKFFNSYVSKIAAIKCL